MLDSVTNPDLDARIILDRTKAVESTVAIDRRNPNRLHIILIIGKGNERWFKDHGKHIPFEGDDHIVKLYFWTCDPAATANHHRVITNPKESTNNHDHS